MPDDNGSGRLDRIERQLESVSHSLLDQAVLMREMREDLQEMRLDIAGLIDHAKGVDKWIEASAKEMATLRLSQLEINQDMKSLLGALRDLIDRIPPENLREKGGPDA